MATDKFDLPLAKATASLDFRIDNATRATNYHGYYRYPYICVGANFMYSEV